MRPSAWSSATAQHDPRQLGEVLGLQAERADGVGGVAVEAGADEHELRLDPRGEVGQLVGELREILAPRRAERRRQVARGAQAVAGARFVGGAGAGVERPAVDREESDAAVVVEHVLRAVAVVHVPVDDEHAIELELVDRHARRDRRRCRTGKSPSRGGAARGVPAGARGRAPCASSPRSTRSTASHAAPAASRATSNDAARHDRVGVEPAAAAPGQRGDAFDVRRVVNGQQARVGWPAAQSGRTHRAGQARAVQPPGDVLQPLGRLGVGARVVVEKSAVGVEQRQRIGSSQRRGEQSRVGPSGQLDICEAR